MTATLGKSVEELVRVYRGALLLANASGIDYSRDLVTQGSGGHGKHGTTSIAPSHGGELPLPIRIEIAAARFVEVFSRELEAERSGAAGRPRAQDKVSAAKRQADRAILDAVGLDPTAVAYIYGRTTEGVRKIRMRHGLDPDTGERIRKAPPITAPAREAAALHTASHETLT